MYPYVQVIGETMFNSILVLVTNINIGFYILLLCHSVYSNTSVLPDRCKLYLLAKGGLWRYEKDFELHHHH